MTDLNEVLHYDPDTGALTFKARGAHLFEATARFSAQAQANFWNGRNAGKPALAQRNARGYLQGWLFGKKTSAHRVIWQLMTGQDPSVIDHINGDPSDNRWANLREVSLSENQRNRRLGKNNTSGAIGVARCRDKWKAQLRIGRKDVYLGVFATVEEASEARAAASRAHGFHENHGQERRQSVEGTGR